MSNKIIKVFKALADVTRVDIVRNVLKRGEVSCHDISELFDLAQPTLSFHLNKLIDAGVILVRKEGASHIYSVDKKFLESAGFDTNIIFNN